MARLARIIGGSILVMAGFLMVFLPGPGLLTMAAGLALLAKDLAWAARLADRIKARIAGSAEPS